MSKARDISKLFSSSVNNIVLNDYLLQSSASSVYATQASLLTIDSDNNPDIYLNMGG